MALSLLGFVTQFGILNLDKWELSKSWTCSTSKVNLQETGKEEEMTSYVGDLLLAIRDSVLVAEKLIQSGVVLKWYMGDDSESSTFYHITKLCNSVLKRIQASQIKELKAQTEVFWLVMIM